MAFFKTLFAASSGILLVACSSDQASQSTTATTTAQIIKNDSSSAVAAQVLATAKNSASKQVQSWRINDTLELECSQPLGSFVTDEQHIPQTIWGQIALRSRRGWYKLLSNNAYWTLYHASVNQDGKLFQLPTVGVEDQINRVRSLNKKPLKVAEDDFFFNPYDVTNLTWTQYLDKDLNELPARQIEADYMGGEFDDKIYCPLPYWISQEKIRLENARHLPTSEQLSAYLELSQDTAIHTGRLTGSYQPILADLLRAYQKYPTSPDTTRLIKEALSSLASTKR